MTRSALLRELFESQSVDGAFPSIIHFRDRTQVDWNGFTTAQVLRALSGATGSSDLQRIRNSALNFLLLCESPVRSGAFGFWPSGSHARGLRPLAEDADDTAIYAVLLARYGWLDDRALLRIACQVLLPHRLGELHQPAPSWLRRGVFLTWLRKDWPAIVDCCVNANVLAFLAYAGLGHLPGYREACAMIEDGIRWAGDSLPRARSLSPFYPDPVELVHAVEHAVCCGATPLEKSLLFLRERRWARGRTANSSSASGRPICGTTYGRLVWTSRAVDISRTVAPAAPLPVDGAAQATPYCPAGTEVFPDELSCR